MPNVQNMFSQGQAIFLYNVARKWLTVTSIVLAPVTAFLYNAPFGRFAPSEGSKFLVDGIKSWIVMELVSPLAFLCTFLVSPLSLTPPARPSFFSPQSILAILYLLHYTNRAIISPLRTPSRSKAHLAVPVSGILFNIVNGSLMGSYLSSPFARIYLDAGLTYARPTFYVGLGLWAVGFVGNIVHDEILLDIRRKANSKGKGKAEQTDGKQVGEHYAIPQGLLYRFVSYPNYFCEWIEWLGFALAAGPFPISSFSSIISIDAFIAVFSPETTFRDLITNPSYLFAPNLAPPYIFFISEVLLMLPRAHNGHKWYQERFGENYPKGRKAVIPFLI